MQITKIKQNCIGEYDITYSDGSTKSGVRHGNRHWPEIKDRVAAGDYVAYEAPATTWDDIRSKRNALLAACDWTQVADCPLNTDAKTTWANYRQQLRDLPDTYATPAEVVWPTDPTVVITYDLNATGTYHLQTCKYCGDTLELYTLDELAELGATPCSVCNPPAYEGYVADE